MRAAAIFVSLLVFSASGFAEEERLAQKAKRYHENQEEPFEGVVFAEIEQGKKSYGTAGLLGKGRPAVTPQTLFEIGSITKTFTGILLADAVLNEKANLEDPVSKFLPSKHLEDLSDESPLHSITLQQLATHTSGLPRIPGDLFAGANRDDPYAHYDSEKMFSYLAGLSESDLEKPGEMSYSNLGFGLLGAILELIEGTTYEELVSEKIFEPLGMTTTYVQRTRDSLPEEAEPLFATGHSRGKAVPAWRIDAHCGAGAIVSSAEDMLRYAEAHITGDAPPGLNEAIQLASRTHEGKLGLGWFVNESKLSHGGGTGGFRTNLGIDLEKKTARLMMKNSTGKLVSFSSEGDFAPVAGYWRAELETPGKTLPILMRIRKDGAVYSHSLSQSVRGIPGSSNTFDGKQLTVGFPAIGGRLEAELEGEDLTGTWQQGKTFPIAFRKVDQLPGKLLSFLKKRMTGEVKDVDGFWSGYLGGKSGLFVVLEIEAIDDTGEARFYSPDQNDAAIEVTELKRDGKTVSMKSESIKASYTAKLNPDNSAMSGIWNQGNPIPLTLKWSAERPRREESSEED